MKYYAKSDRDRLVVMCTVNTTHVVGEFHDGNLVTNENATEDAQSIVAQLVGVPAPSMDRVARRRREMRGDNGFLPWNR